MMPILTRSAMIMGLVLCAASARGSSVTVVIGSASEPEGKPVAIPVLVRGAQQLGALRLDLRYDPTVLEVQKVEPGQPGFPAANIAHHVVAPGRMRLVMNTSASESVSGDGELCRVLAIARGPAGASSELAADAVRAWDNTRPEALPAEMLVTLEPGRFTVATAGFSPLLPTAIAAAAIALLLAVIIGRKARKVRAGN